MELHLQDARVLVTGGTRGIGRAIVEEFAAEGAAVEFCARDAGEIEATEKALAGRDVRGVQVDVRDGAALTGWVAAAADRLGGLDAVVANVSALAIPESEENWYTSFEVDLPNSAPIDLAVHDLVGRRVATIASGVYPAGRRVFDWDGAGMRGGIYYVRLRVNGQVLSTRVALLKNAH